LDIIQSNLNQKQNLKKIQFSYNNKRNEWQAICPYCGIKRYLSLADIQASQNYICPVCEHESQVDYKI